MKAQHAYEDRASYMYSDVRWLLVLDGQTVQVFCNGLSRTYDIAEPVTDFKVEDNYVFIYVRHSDVKFYQFKFESDMFFVGDIFDTDDEFIGEFACHSFSDDEV